MCCGGKDGDLPRRGLGLDVLVEISELEFGEVGEVNLEYVSCSAPWCQGGHVLTVEESFTALSARDVLKVRTAGVLVAFEAEACVSAEIMGCACLSAVGIRGAVAVPVMCRLRN